MRLKLDGRRDPDHDRQVSWLSPCHRQALEIGQDLTNQNSAYALGWILLAEAKHRSGLSEEAVRDYRRAIDLAPSNAMMRLRLGEALKSLGRENEGIEQFRAAAKLEPDDLDYQARLGAALLDTGEYDEGMRLLEECLRERPDDDGIRRALAIGHCMRASSEWTYVPEGEDLPEGWYATSKSQVKSAQREIRSATALNISEPETSKIIDEFREDVDGNLKRKFISRKLNIGITIIYFLIGWAMITEGVNGIVPAIYFAGSAVFYFFASRMPIYIINREILANRGPSMGQRAVQLAAKIGGEAAAGWAIILGALVFLPGVAAWKYYNNYVKV